MKVYTKFGFSCLPVNSFWKSVTTHIFTSDLLIACAKWMRSRISSCDHTLCAIFKGNYSLQLTQRWPWPLTMLLTCDVVGPVNPECWPWPKNNLYYFFCEWFLSCVNSLCKLTFNSDWGQISTMPYSIAESRIHVLWQDKKRSTEAHLVMLSTS